MCITSRQKWTKWWISVLTSQRKNRIGFSSLRLWTPFDISSQTGETHSRWPAAVSDLKLFRVKNWKILAKIGKNTVVRCRSLFSQRSKRCKLCIFQKNKTRLSQKIIIKQYWRYKNIVEYRGRRARIRGGSAGGMNLRHATDGAQEPIVDEVGRKKKVFFFFFFSLLYISFHPPHPPFFLQFL